MYESSNPHGLNLDFLRQEIRKEYRAVADNPEQDFHFHTGRDLSHILNYENRWLEAVPEEVIASFAGTGNPFSMGRLYPGERVVDLGCGAGIDSFIAADQVGRTGVVMGIDMTEEMLAKARAAAEATDLPQLSFHQGYLEDLPVEDDWADVVISNGVLNLCPDKQGVYREIHRVVRTGGRLQIADIMVHKEVPEGAKQKIDLWTG
jgi:SAM-dependent methyltransferase